MLEFEPQYPRMGLAVRLISADAGDHQVERFGGAQLGELIERRLRAAAEGLTPFELEEIETFLAGLERADLETLCIGDQDEAKALQAPAYVDAFLQRAFEGLADA